MAETKEIKLYTFNTIVKDLMKAYSAALKDPSIDKPLAHALKDMYEDVNRNEKPRNRKEVSKANDSIGEKEVGTV